MDPLITGVPNLIATLFLASVGAWCGITFVQANFDRVDAVIRYLQNLGE